MADTRRDRTRIEGSAFQVTRNVLSHVTVATVKTEPAGQLQMAEPTTLVLPSGQVVHDVDWVKLNVLVGQAVCNRRPNERAGASALACAHILHALCLY